MVALKDGRLRGGPANEQGFDFKRVRKAPAIALGDGDTPGPPLSGRQRNKALTLRAVPATICSLLLRRPRSGCWVSLLRRPFASPPSDHLSRTSCGRHGQQMTERELYLGWASIRRCVARCLPFLRIVLATPETLGALIATAVAVVFSVAWCCWWRD